ncbi:unnamed protein product [Sphagnum balticum]
MAENGWKQLLLPFLMLLLCAVHEAHEENVIVRERSEQRKPLWALPWLLPSPSSCDSSNPVCAEGQVTYISACHALADHAIILSPGACDESNRKPAACTVNCFRAAPVCGSDGLTYWCGAAEAQCAGVEVAHEGYCEIWKVSDEVGSTGSHAAQSLQLVHMVLLLLAGLLIVGGLA